MTIQQLFKGHQKVLLQVVNDLSKKDHIPAREIAQNRIEPILPDIEKNAGQEMDPTFIVYLIQYGLTKLVKF